MAKMKYSRDPRLIEGHWDIHQRPSRRPAARLRRRKKSVLNRFDRNRESTYLCAQCGGMVKWNTVHALARKMLMCPSCTFWSKFHELASVLGPGKYEQWVEDCAVELEQRGHDRAAKYVREGKLVKNPDGPEWLLRIESPGDPIVIHEDPAFLADLLEEVDPHVEQVMDEFYRTPDGTKEE